MALWFIRLSAQRGCCSVFDGGVSLQKEPILALPELPAINSI